LIAFGLSHFFYLELTTPLVPAWLGVPVLWAYATGSIYTVGGVAMVLGLAARVASLAAAANITLITLLVWVPIVAAGGLSAMPWQEKLGLCALMCRSSGLVSAL